MKPGTRITYKHLLIGGAVALIIAAAIGAAITLSSRPDETQTVPISEILNLADRGQITSATVEGTTVTAIGADGVSLRATKEDGTPIVDALRRQGVQVTVSAPRAPVWPVPLLIILPALVAFGLIAASRKGPVQGEASRFTKMSRVATQDQRPNITFADVAGIEEAKQELSEVVEFLKHPERFHALGARVPRGVLLVGPPGTGKTLLAKAVAGEAGVPFFSLSGSNFVEMFVGVGAARVRDLFTQAKKQAPSIIFIDELDAVGRQRGTSVSGGNEEREHTLNQLLVEMDGFGTNTSVVVLAATNRADVLDPALLRPGRFDRRVTVDAPDIKGRLAILAVHAQDKPLAEDADLDALARRTAGLAGADLANLLNEAAILAARSGRFAIARTDLDEALLRVMAGPERKSRIITDHEKLVVAYHEAGHAIVMTSQPHADPVRMVSIVARGRALGITLQQPDEDRYLMTREQLFARMAGAMGGRAAEELIFGTVTTGAGQDIEYTTAIARRMVCDFGMSELGATAFGARNAGDPNGGLSEAVAARVDVAVMGLVDDAYRMAKHNLTERHHDLVRLAERLIEVETVEEEELTALLADESASERPLALAV